MNPIDEMKIQKIKEHIKKIEYYKFLNNGLLYWDKITKMPSKGIRYRSETMSFIAGEIHKFSQDKEFIDLVSDIGSNNIDELDIITNSMIRKIKRNYENINKIPENEYKNYIYLIAETELVWSNCKKNNDFNTIVPYLEKVVDYFRSFAEYWGYEEEPYDAFFSFYETGLNSKIVDDMLITLRNYIVDLLKRIKKSKVIIDKEVFNGHFDKDIQNTMVTDILKRIGFDFEAGRLDEGEHPTILPNYNKDVRIIIKYDETDFRPAFTSALHEGSQALYEQGISSDLYGTFLAEPSSMVMLEAVARFFENFFGKSEEFWDLYYPIIKDYFPLLKNVSKKSFFEAINSVETTYIRMDADELTYNLHVIIRYEIEKDLFNNKIEVKDIPEIWNEKYRNYLGIEPPSHSLGALQDVHWFSGYFGYFPNYILGNFSAAQIFNKLKSDFPNYNDIVAGGEWIKISEWFKEKIFIHGSIYNSQELIYLVTDEKLNAQYFINYLDEKYRKIYDI